MSVRGRPALRTETYVAIGVSVVIGGQKFSGQGEATKTSLGYIVTFSWNGVKRRALKSSCAMHGEVGGIVDGRE